MLKIYQKSPSGNGCIYSCRTTHSEVILGYIIRENTVKGHKIRTKAARDDGIAFKVLAALIKDQVQFPLLIFSG